MYCVVAIFLSSYVTINDLLLVPYFIFKQFACLFSGPLIHQRVIKMAEVRRYDSTSPNESEQVLHADLNDEHGIRDTQRDEKFLSRVLPSRTAIYFMSIYFLLAFSELVPTAPLVKLFERSLCISYYTRHHPNIVPPGQEIPERLCKVPEIQASLATIRGWKSTLDMIPGKARPPNLRNLLSREIVLVAIPFAKLADRHGRPRLMTVCLIGLALSYCEIFIVCQYMRNLSMIVDCPLTFLPGAFPQALPLPFVLISSSLLLCGGGFPSAISMMWAMASESIPSSQRYLDYAS